MKRLFKNILVLSVAILSVFFVLGYITDHGLRKSNSGNYAQWNNIYGSKINADIVIMGSSRARTMVSPRIMDSVTSMSSYNLGMSGLRFRIEYARFKVYMQHNKPPKYVIQNVDYQAFTDNEDLFEYEQFLPYLNDPIIRDITSQYKGKFTLPELYIPFFKYNNHVDLIKEGIKCYFRKQKNADSLGSKGYFPINDTWSGTFDVYKTSNPNGVSEPTMPEVLHEFEEYLAYCKAHNIHVILQFAPIYYELTAMQKNAKQLHQLFMNLSVKYNIPFLDYSNDTLCNDRRYFFDSQHLNILGAEVFSLKLANDVKAIIHNDSLAGR